MKAKLSYLVGLSLLLMQGRLFAEDAQLPPPDDSLWQMFIMIAIALLFFYFILWRPEQQRRKAMEEQRNGLQKGDRVAAMGIIGTIVRIGEQTAILKMYDGSKIEVYKATITDVLPNVDENGKKIETTPEE